MQILYGYPFPLVIILLSGVISQFYRGDRCLYKRTNETGTCKYLTDCQPAVVLLRKGIYPEHCGFEQTAVVVCCVATKRTALPVNLTPTTTTTTTTDLSTTITTAKATKVLRNPGDISRQKCKEYEELSYEEQLSPVLMGPVTVEKVGICPWNLEPAVSGGIKVKPGEFPHMAFLKYEGNQRCGGTLISEKFVLTAGHCVDKARGVVPISVRLGDININDTSDDTYVQEVGVRQAHVHPDFVQPIQYNDIALIELDRSPSLSLDLKPACLYTEEILNFNSATVTGWGRTEDHVLSDHMLKAGLELFSRNSCNERFKHLTTVFPYGIDYDLEVCAGSYGSNKDTCGGDSGGPLQVYSTDVYCSHYVIGVTSFGLGCGQANNPAVYTKIYPYLEWIEDIVWPK